MHAPLRGTLAGALAALSTFAVLLPLPRAQGERVTRERPTWHGDFDMARAESARTGKLLLVAWNIDGENTNDHIAAVVYRNARVVKALRDVTRSSPRPAGTRPTASVRASAP